MLQIEKIIEINEFSCLIIYYAKSTSSYDAVIMDNSMIISAKDSQTSIQDYVAYTHNARKRKNRTELITLEFDSDFYNSISLWCGSLNITFEQLIYAFIEFIVTK